MTDTRLTTQQGKRQVMIVDDHPLLRAGIAAMIRNEPDLEFCCESDSADEALVLARHHRPDLVIVDLTLAEGSGLELIKRLTSRDAAPRVLVCSMHDESLFAQRVLDAGASGYINKHEATSHIIDAIRRVLAGRIYLSERMLQRRDDNRESSVHDLSDRELEVLGLIGQGLGPSRIAHQLHISIKTVETHRENIKKKLYLRTGNELTRYAMQWLLEQG
jgi:DNA-binding NarL/FixJ family response regulator